MTIRLIDGVDVPDALERWPLPAQPPHVDSPELGWLMRDLRRYSLGHASGRSYLIAGHRGAGKTALVARAVDAVASAIMRDSVKDGSSIGNAPFQRPLLVKLHGPSMLEPQPVARPETRPDAETDVVSPGGAHPRPETSGAPGYETPPAPGIPAALVQMTIGLYRALATEVGVGYRAHALRRQEVPDGDERAAQLVLDLDLGANPADLARHWSAIGRLPGGVLWPASSDATLRMVGMVDQGVREITALATAGQAYQVCTGRVKYEAVVKESATRSSTVDGAGRMDVGDGLTKLAALGVGALSGAAVLPSAGGFAAAATGVFVWLLGSATVRWSWTAKRSGDRSSDYSFIRNMEAATLDRELPAVIGRVRQAGLAPVFVIDELDKVDRAADRLMDLIGRLKHLVADYGFFCFLVNRDCFEAIDARARAGAYPAEHTLFTERLLVRPDAGMTFRYLFERTASDPTDDYARFARAVFALVMMHESRLNLTELARQIARHTRPNGSIGDAVDWGWNRQLVIATVQLVIDEALRTPALIARMNADPAFGQLALDAVYYPSRTWAAGERVDASRDALRRHLEERRDGGDPDGGRPGIGEEELTILHRHMLSVLRSLSDLGTLRSTLDRKLVGDEDVVGHGDVLAVDVVPSTVSAICEDRGGGTFDFLFRSDGDPADAHVGEMDAAQRTDAQEAVAFCEGFLGLLSDLGVPLDDLASTSLVGPSYHDVVARARKGVTAALALNAFDEDVAGHLAALQRLKVEAGANGERLGALLLVTASVAREADSGRATLRRIRRLIAMDDHPSTWFDAPRPLAEPPVPGTANGLARWRERLDDRILPAIGQERRDVDDYASLRDPIVAFLAHGSPRRIRPGYPMLFRAAAGRLPAAALCVDLTAMLVGDWSRLALASMPTIAGAATAPYWMLIAALRALGFGRSALVALASEELADSLASTGWSVGSGPDEVRATFATVWKIASSAPEAPAGILAIDTRSMRLWAERPSPRRGVLAINEKDYDGARTALRWLEAVGIFAGLIDARSDGSR